MKYSGAAGIYPRARAATSRTIWSLRFRAASALKFTTIRRRSTGGAIRCYGS